MWWTPTLAAKYDSGLMTISNRLLATALAGFTVIAAHLAAQGTPQQPPPAPTQNPPANPPDTQRVGEAVADEDGAKGR